MVFADVLVVLQPLDLDVIRMETVNHASEGDFGLSHLLGVRREDEDERRGDLAYEKKTVGVGQNRRVWWVLGFFFGWGGGVVWRRRHSPARLEMLLLSGNWSSSCFTMQVKRSPASQSWVEMVKVLVAV